MECTIPVVFGVDNNYLLPAFVVMNSILKNSKSSFQFILISKDDVENNSSILCKRLEKIYTNFKAQIIKIDDKIFENHKISNPHLSLAAYNRLLIPKLVNDFEKCIYLDGDLLVNGDLKELFDIDISDVYIAGVKDCHIIENNNQIHKEMLNLESLNNYINSGVLLMNLKKLREDNMSAKFLEESKNMNFFEDQDAINKCCNKKVINIPLKYNLFHFYMGKGIKKIYDEPYDPDDFEFDTFNPVILHMGSIYKPWYSNRFKGSSQWWSMADLYKGTPQYEQYIQNMNHPQLYIFDITYIIELCKNAEKIVIWGYTKYGKSICDTLLKNGVTQIIAFGDNNVEYEGEEYKDICVVTLDKITSWTEGICQPSAENILWIIACKKIYNEVIQQLLKKGISSEKIIGGMYSFGKNRMYYRALDPSYYRTELREIAICEDMQLQEIEKIIYNSQWFPKEYHYLKKKYWLEEWICLN